MILKKDLNPNPIVEFQKWYDLAINKGIEKADAFALATASKNGTPSVRTILFKGLNKNGLRFFTNYESAKAHNLKENPQASILFFWGPLERQVRFDGTIEILPESESDEYWASRPRGSKIGAYASPQSREVKDREELDNKVKEMDKKFEGSEIPRPKFWGGYVLIPNKIEFWEGLPDRLHDRFIYKKIKDKWEIFRLAP